MKDSLLIFIQGRVQGVGFRPFVSNLATSLGLKGYVKNIGRGVEVLVQGESKEEFLQLLPLQAPPMAHIDKIETRYQNTKESKDFLILNSQSMDKISTPPIPDFALCHDCAKEILDSNQRRFFYPLINCTNCGPRFSVIKAFPYDRERTCMQPFCMCDFCSKQYHQASNRFFHAQAISCPECGPKAFWKGEECRDFVSVFQEMASLIKAGEVLCIQGIGGFHLVCDAGQEKAVDKIRRLKRRPKKPLALMCKDIKQVKQIAHLSPKEEEVLQSKQAPIVLLENREKFKNIALDRYGVILAYTPIYKLLFEFLDHPLVVTSANLKGEPILYQSQKVEELGLPFVFSHQREILQPIEDSLVQVLSTQKIMLLRNARGYAPSVFKLARKIPNAILALGANQKVSFALAFDEWAIVSPYIGDLDNLASFERFKSAIDTMRELYKLEFQEVICDLHPQYKSTELAFELCSSPIQIQHHYAHTLSVCFEHHLHSKVLSFCFDGTGYGSDGKIWGGEVLLADAQGFERILHFKNFALLGGGIATRDIARNFYALLGESVPLEQKQEFFIKRGKSKQDLETLELMQKKGLNSPLTSSVGRIFDALAWVCGLEEQSYEGESGEWIGSLYDERVGQSYGFRIEGEEIVLDILAIYEDAHCGLEPSLIASKFLNALIEIVAKIAELYSYDVVLCGGVFCNKILSSKLLERLENCYIGEKIPPNDGSIALGQLYWALQRR